jgi:hypothetical protein
MALDKRQIGLINGLLYFAQFDYPMTPAVPRVYEMVVNTVRPTRPIPEVLSDIQAILAEESIPVASLVVEGKSENEIREFLERLAEDIEQRNPNAIRSGRPVPQSGQWFCYGDLGYSVFLSRGDLAPEYNTSDTVWVLEPTILNPTARERILGDFAENFIPNALRGIQFYDPEIYAQAFFKRLTVSADAQMIADLSLILEQLIQNPDTSLLDEIKNASGFDWTEDEVRWTFLQKFVGGVIRRLAEKQRQSHGDVSADH